MRKLRALAAAFTCAVLVGSIAAEPLPSSETSTTTKTKAAKPLVQELPPRSIWVAPRWESIGAKTHADGKLVGERFTESEVFVFNPSDEAADVACFFLDPSGALVKRFNKTAQEGSSVSCQQGMIGGGADGVRRGGSVIVRSASLSLVVSGEMRSKQSWLDGSGQLRAATSSTSPISFTQKSCSRGGGSNDGWELACEYGWK